MRKIFSMQYAGSVALGLNDALVEITGVLAGMTLAFGDTQTVLIAGLVTGLAASLSMAASEFLEAKQDEQEGSPKNPIISSTYTGIAYLFVTIALIMPYFFMTEALHALFITVTVAILIIAAYTKYVSSERKQSWRKQFLQMAAISLSVTAISFVVGHLINIKF